jgi:hypothetical protein
VTDPQRGAPADPRERRGRIVNEVRRAYDAEQAEAEGRPRFCIPEWEERPAYQRELDMRIGAAVAAGAEAKLAAIGKLCRRPLLGTAAEERWAADILAIIGSEGDGENG